MANQNLYENLKIKRDGADVEMSAEIPASIVEKYVDQVVENAKQDLELPGFRKGQVPMELVRKNLNPLHVYEDAADMALREAYPQIVANEKLAVVTAPRVTLTKLAPGNPVEFKAQVGVSPEFKLPDYKKIGKTESEKQEPVLVTDEEIDGTIKNIQMMRMDPEQIKDQKDVKLPELTDEYVKSLGQFSSVDDFKKKIREGTEEEKKVGAKRVLRENIAAKLIEATNIPLPSLMVEKEVGQLRTRRCEEIQRMGLQVDEYLKKVNKSEEDLGKEEKFYIERQLRTRFVLEKIAETEKISADPKVVEENVEYLLERNKSADPEHIRNYVESMLTNEAVLKMLEEKPGK
ncbi:MAG: trigger factor [Candidatus Liptonbacteria bacterium]